MEAGCEGHVRDVSEAGGSILSVRESKYIFQGPGGRREKDVWNRVLRRETEDKHQMASLILGKRIFFFFYQTFWMIPGYLFLKRLL